VTLVSGNIRFVPIFEGVHWREESNDSGVIENMDFHGFQRYVFSTLRNEVNAIIHCVQKKTPTHSFFHISMNDASI